MRKLLKKAFWLGTALLFPMVLALGCSSDSSDGGNTTNSTVTPTGSTNYISAVTIKADSSTITALGSTKLTAESTIVGSPTITYTWSITAGGNYASISGTGATVTLNGTNKENTNQSVSIKVTASDGTNSKDAVTTVSVQAAGTTPPATSSTATVTLKFLNGNEDLKVACTQTSSGYTFTATPPDSSATYTYAWYVDDVVLNTNGATCTVENSKIKDGTKIFVTAVDSALPSVIYSAEYGF